MISVILPTCGRSQYLLKSLVSLVNQDIDRDIYEVIVVDCSKNCFDSTLEMLSGMCSSTTFPSIKYVVQNGIGLTDARHLGANLASGDILAFTEDDAILSSNWIRSVAELFEYDNSLSIAGGKNLPIYESSLPTWLDSLWHRQDGIDMCTHLSLLDIGEAFIEIHPNYIWTLNMAIRRNVLYDLGGFHPDIMPQKYKRFQGNGETGLTMKLFDAGLKAIYCPDMIVYHHVPEERLSFDYMYKRNFFQGICTSFEKIRRYGKPSLESVERWIVGKVDSIGSNDIASVIRNALIDGYVFHQMEVINDPSLLEWVLTPNYFDKNPIRIENAI